MDPLMTSWIFVIGIIIGLFIGIIIVHRLAVIPLQKKLERIKDNEKKVIDSESDKEIILDND